MPDEVIVSISTWDKLSPPIKWYHPSATEMIDYKASFVKYLDRYIAVNVTVLVFNINVWFETIF